MKRGLYLAPFEALADAAVLADLAARAERAGWDGVFLWDHILWDPPVEAVADPWVCLAAMAVATERIALGPMVTPLARRRMPKLARETVTLDRLSGGRLVLGIGLGGDRGGELSRFGEEGDRVARGRLLDERLEQLLELWGPDGFAPRAVQEPRIPVWAGMKWPNRRPLRRAARLDGVFPVDLGGPDDLRDLLAALGPLRGDASGPYDVVVTGTLDDDPAPWAAAGATWHLAGSGPRPDLAAVAALADAGPAAAA